jgi:hypothetical protein
LANKRENFAVLQKLAALSSAYKREKEPLALGPDPQPIDSYEYRRGSSFGMDLARYLSRHSRKMFEGYIRI